MKRWNGWGDDHTTYALPDKAAEFVTDLVGGSKTPQDASFKDVAAGVPPTRCRSSIT